MAYLLTLGWKEALCVALFSAIVWAAHRVLLLLAPLEAALPRKPRPAFRSLAPLVSCAVALLAGGALGYFFVLPAAARLFGSRGYPGLLWNATVGPALILAAGPAAFHLARARMVDYADGARRFVFLTPLLMLVAALATATRDVFPMIVVFLPMCVACVSGIAIAEAARAVSKQTPVAMSRVLAWGARFAAESVLGAGAGVLLLVLFRR